MRSVAISLLALTAFSGCLALHAHLPEEMVRHAAREDGVDVGAICAHEGQRFSEGAVVCMAEQRMICDPNERWMQDGTC